MHILKEFKNFANAEINLLKPVTIMIGKNGAGKSNVIEGVELLAQIAHGRPLYEISDVGRGNGTTFEIRGGMQACVRNIETPEDVNPATTLLTSDALFPTGNFTLGLTKAAIKFDGESQLIDYEVCIGFYPEARITHEHLRVGRRTFFNAEQSDSKDILNVSYDNFAKGGKKPIVKLSADRSVLSRYHQFAPDGSKKIVVDARGVVVGVESYLNAAFVFDPHAKMMRNYERIGQTVLNKDGSNLSAILYSLAQGDEDKKASLQRILELIRQLPEEPFDNFDFTTTRRGDVLLGLKRGGATIMDARVLSDGTLRALAILTALETVQTGSRIVLEEMDNGIHPSRIKALVDHIWSVSERRKLNVLVTTHNPAALNCLSNDQLKSVVVCHYDATENTSKLTPLFDLPNSEMLLEGRQLGDLITRQVFEKYLQPAFSTDRQAQLNKWLESLG